MIFVVYSFDARERQMLVDVIHAASKEDAIKFIETVRPYATVCEADDEQECRRFIRHLIESLQGTEEENHTYWLNAIGDYVDEDVLSEDAVKKVLG